MGTGLISALTVLILLTDFVAAQQQHPDKFYRPKRFTPPVHAQPLRGQQTTAPLRGNQTQRRFPVQQVAGTQDFNSQASGSGSKGANQWRTRDASNGLPRLNHPSPQKGFSNPTSNPTYSSGDSNPYPAIANPDPSIPAPLQYSDSRSNQNRTRPRDSFDTGTTQEYQTPVDQNSVDSLLFQDEQAVPQSVLIRQPSDEAANSLRELRVEPKRLRDRQPDQRNTLQSRYRGNTGGVLQQDLDPGFDGSANQGRGLKSCDQYRTELLNNPITDIVVDISPGRPTAAAQGNQQPITRTWTDCLGNTLGTGTLVGLERSYIVITDDAGDAWRISMSRLSDGDLAEVSQYWVLPNECSLGCYPYEERQWACNTVFWKASSLCHKPLYFENRQLERYGHSHGPIVQPLHSTAHFFTSLILWPYNTGIHPPNECLYSLGFYRPGDCAPWLKDPFPFSMQGALRQGAFVGGAVGILP